ncbi:MAG: glycosyltransferase family 1 protein [Chloroflexota bacterium]
MIYIDVSPAVHSRAGLGRYAEKLAAEVSKLRDVSLFHNIDHNARMPKSLEHLSATTVKAGYKPWRMAVLLSQWSQIGSKALNRKLPDGTIFHATEHLLAPVTNIPTVITIHDIIPHLFPEYHTRLNYNYLKVAMPLYCQRANAIITISEASKFDLVNHYKLPAEKITVIPEAAAEHFFVPEPADIDRVRAKYGLPNNYLLHIGTIEPRKNLDRLVDALVILRATYPDLKLILAGSKGWLVDKFFERLKSDQLEGIVISPGWVDDKDLPGLIAGARLGVQPSLYEGFGLPILEHMACGQVVVCSNRSSLPEVGGDAAAYFNPESVDEMVSVIDRLLSSQDEWTKRRELGLKQAAKFSWQRTAAETVDLYDEIRDRWKKGKR